MAKWAFMVDPDTNNIGLYDEPVPATVGNEKAEWQDPNSPPNAPLNDPDNHLAQLYWHIQYNNMEVVHEDFYEIAHASVAGATTSGGGTGTGDNSQSGVVMGRGYSYTGTIANHLLYNHGLGYVPICYAAVGDDILTPGYIVQITAGGGARYVSLWADTTSIYLHEYAGKETAVIPAIDIEYRLIVIRNQRLAEGNDPPRLIDFDEDTGILKLGDGRWSSDARYLQVVPGGTPFGLCVGRSMDFRNGAMRFVAPDGTIYDPIPSTYQIGMRFGGQAGTSLPTTGGYTGSFTGDEVIQVQAP